jgi:hypothetical protein
MTVAAFRPDDLHPGSLLRALRPFLLLAALAFFAGFGGYLILGPANVMNLTPDSQRPNAQASAATPATPASVAADDWNASRTI